MRISDFARLLHSTLCFILSGSRRDPAEKKVHKHHFDGLAPFSDHGSEYIQHYQTPFRYKSWQNRCDCLSIHLLDFRILNLDSAKLDTSNFPRKISSLKIYAASAPDPREVQVLSDDSKTWQYLYGYSRNTSSAS